MRVGILTFHWARNYGAILQAFALQSALRKIGHEAFVINYRPRQHAVMLSACADLRHFWRLPGAIREYIKDRKLERFRRTYLNETHPFGSLVELMGNAPALDAYVSGSDQVWNPYFTAHGEGGPTPTYFLPFGPPSVRRIAYAVSFGCETYPPNAAPLLADFVRNLDIISVREDSGRHILEHAGHPGATLVVDPTLLLEAGDYPVGSSTVTRQRQGAFVYILRSEQKRLKLLLARIRQEYDVEFVGGSFPPLAVEDWLARLRDARAVVTNSYHGMIFSILFRRQFVVLAASGESAGMNDRFRTLLSRLDLLSRFLIDPEPDEVSSLLSAEIDWTEVEARRNLLRTHAYQFLSRSLDRRLLSEN